MIGRRATGGVSRDRAPAVAGSFYPAAPGRLSALVARLLDEAGLGAPAADAAGSTRPAGLLVPHAGLEYSGLVAAAAWRLVATSPDPAGDPTVVLLGTNHRDPWLDGACVWPAGTWTTPLGRVPVDERLAASIADLGPPFHPGAAGHVGEHSIEVQLPFLQSVVPAGAIVPIAVSCGRGPAAVDAGTALGRLLQPLVAAGRVVVVISSDMAHYPDAEAARRVTETLLPALGAVDAEALASSEAATTGWPVAGLACGMCGIDPAVLGLATLRAIGAVTGTPILAATSADAGGPRGRVVGYLSMRFDR